MKRCLYISDLDGTLLRRDETLSEHTCRVINRLTENGGLFSYATARSYVTAKKITKGLDAKIPLIVYNVQLYTPQLVSCAPGLWMGFFISKGG